MHMESYMQIATIRVDSLAQCFFADRNELEKALSTMGEHPLGKHELERLFDKVSF